MTKHNNNEKQNMTEKIIGIGTDIVNIMRIEKLRHKHPLAFPKKILHEEEIKQYERVIVAKKSHYLAKRFAAKEAASKALGTGIRDGLGFNHIAVLNDYHGAPYVIIESPHIKASDYNIRISLSDDYPFAAAFVIITQTSKAVK
jgi:holo-[acyl-carrier protein] synthase